ncbi:hypothetical protein VHUM_03091 [Vanrija humicola]|uniref:Uncharacterized protein n=1 Tax=Vanrija humicola TaxID=5417 RepID=A0A7D8UY61_VANHU|nr:hypothetical protein VHUM_03091 [Vanrija humicola]
MVRRRCSASSRPEACTPACMPPRRACTTTRRTSRPSADAVSPRPTATHSRPDLPPPDQGPSGDSTSPRPVALHRGGVLLPLGPTQRRRDGAADRRRGELQQRRKEQRQLPAHGHPAPDRMVHRVAAVRASAARRRTQGRQVVLHVARAPQLDVGERHVHTACVWRAELGAGGRVDARLWRRARRRDGEQHGLGVGVGKRVWLRSGIAARIVRVGSPERVGVEQAVVCRPCRRRRGPRCWRRGRRRCCHPVADRLY